MICFVQQTVFVACEVKDAICHLVDGSSQADRHLSLASHSTVCLIREGLGFTLRHYYAMPHHNRALSSSLIDLMPTSTIDWWVPRSVLAQLPG
jgi:hypothetical protein